MGFFDRIFRKRQDDPRGPDDLRARLFDAVAASDDRRLTDLCRAEQDAVRVEFPRWTTVPAEVRADPARLQWYGQGLVTVAQCFAETLGDPSLLQRLVGDPDDNPLVRWKQQLHRAQAMVSELQYDEALALLAGVLVDVHGLQGSGADDLLPKTLGLLGECHFQTGDAAGAVLLMQQALASCQQANDAEGVQAYLGNLYEVHRWLDQPGPASEYALLLAGQCEQQGDTAQAQRHRRQAQRVAAGEPRNRVAIVDEQRYEIEAAEFAGGRVQFVFERDRITLRPAVVWTERGEALGSAGRHEEALAAFGRAAQADPHDPHCRYQAAFTLLHLRRYAEAVVAYTEVERLAPGWFHCRADLWMARELAAGTLDHATFMAIHAVQDGSMAPTDRLLLTEEALRRAPQVGLLHLLRGKELARLGRVAVAVTALREGLACDPDADTRTRLLVELASRVGEPERDGLLGEAESLAGNLVAAATARVLRASFAS